jgi:hypothetical protein
MRNAFHLSCCCCCWCSCCRCCLLAAFACIYALYDGLPYIIGMAVTAGLVIVCCIAIHVMCPQYDRPSYRAPFFPYLPGASLLLNSFLMVRPCDLLYCVRLCDGCIAVVTRGVF